MSKLTDITKVVAMERGQQVWTKKLEPSQVRGSMIKEQYGHYSGTLRSAIPLVITKARRNYRCADCGAVIEKGKLHGGPYYDHYCLGCVTPEKPEPRFKPSEPRKVA